MVLSKTDQIKGGFTIWARQTLESEIFKFKPAVWFKIWFYIVSRVNHKDNKYFNRGSNFFTFDEIARATASTYSQVKHCIDYLRQHAGEFGDRMIDTQKTTRGIKVVVNNYLYYQDPGNYKKTDRKTDKRQTKDRQKTDRSQTINNNVNNEKNVNNDNSIYEQPFLEFWDEYPKKLAKGLAYRAWGKVKARPSLDVLVAAIRKQKQTKEWLKDNGEWIPHPATWLNQRRWEDEIFTPGKVYAGLICRQCNKKVASISNGICWDCEQLNKKGK